MKVSTRWGWGRRKSRLFRLVASYVVLNFWALLILFPMLWMVSGPLRRPLAVGDAAGFLPWDSLKLMLQTWHYLLVGQLQVDIWRPFINTLAISLSSATISLLLGSLGGYGLARFEYRVGRLQNRDIAFGFIAQRMLPPVVIVFPLVILFQYLHLLDTQLGMILVYTAFGIPLVLWIMRDAFVGMPREAEESALVDGCSRLGCFFRVAIPMATPGLVASFLLVFIYSTNEYLMALLLTLRHATTMPIFIAGSMGGRSVQWWFMASMTILALAPAISLGLMLEKYLVRGLVSGTRRL